ncbi:hypothetical protein GY12_10075 [Micrococcus luteus]|nr:hypothetical protein GY12_10075 [Micrococcus luteus]
MAGQIDLWATGDPAGRYLAKQEGISGLRTVLRFDSAELYLALNKEMPDEIVAKLQAALDQMRAEGFLEKSPEQLPVSTEHATGHEPVAGHGWQSR